MTQIPVMCGKDNRRLACVPVEPPDSSLSSNISYGAVQNSVRLLVPSPTVSHVTEGTLTAFIPGATAPPVTFDTWLGPVSTFVLIRAGWATPLATMNTCL